MKKLKNGSKHNLSTRKQKGDYMSSGRPTTDPNPRTIAVRVNEQTMYKLEQEANRTDRKVSEIVRDLITQNFK